MDDRIKKNLVSEYYQESFCWYSFNLVLAQAKGCGYTDTDFHALHSLLCLYKCRQL